PRTLDHVCYVAPDCLVDVHAPDAVHEALHRPSVDDGLDVPLRNSLHVPEYRESLLPRSVTDLYPHQEPVHLRLGERVSPLELNRVLGREHHEGGGELQRRPLDRHLLLLHRLEEGGLRLRRRTVYFIGEAYVSENRPLSEFEVVLLLILDVYSVSVHGDWVG